jgi:hypothetical protein
MSPKTGRSFRQIVQVFPQVVHSLVGVADKLNSIFMTVCNIHMRGLRIFAYGFGNNLFPFDFTPYRHAKIRRIDRRIAEF